VRAILSLLCLLLLLTPLWWLLWRDFIKGLAYATFLCVSMTTFLRIPLPGSLPQLTIFRLILISLFIFWFPRRRQHQGAVPLAGFFWFWALANLASLLFTSVGFVTSLKRYLDFVLEVSGFYLIVITSLENREQGQRLLHAAVAGIAFVAVLAFLEKYARFNPVHYFVAPDEEDASSFRDVAATFQHRILLGTAMAMTWPLAFALLNQAQQKGRKLLLWASVVAILAACYFAQSRGPWLAAGLAGGVMFVMAGWQIRRRLVWLPILACCLLASRPGVWDTILGSAKVTADKDSFKGGTFRYRLELWKVAWTEVSKSPLRTLVGYGPGCGLESDIEWNLSYRDFESDVWSWDNHYAYELFQSGVIGLTALLCLYLAVARNLFRLYREADASDRQILAALLASVLVLVFMMSNVLIYAKQLNFLFWTIAAVGLSYRFPVHALAAENQSLDATTDSLDELETESQSTSSSRQAYAPNLW
jgi:O-antigen ligase